MKQEIIDQLQALVKEEISEGVFQKAEELGAEYLKTCDQLHHEQLDHFVADGGSAKDFEPPKDPLDGKFSELINILNDREKKFKKFRKEETSEKLDAKKKIVDELEKLIAEETNINRAFHRFKELQLEWNDIGNVPTSKYKAIQADYHRHVHNFYYNMKLSKDLKELDFKRNYEHRMALLSKIESLLQIESIKGAERLLKLYRIEWSELGPTAQDTVEPLRTRYRELIANVIQHIRDHYQKIQEEEQKHLEEKKGLVEKVQKIVEDNYESPRQWQSMTETVEEILNQWKQVGRAPKDESDKVWQDLRQAFNAFYAKKRDYFANLKQNYKTAKERKLALIEQTQAIANQKHEVWDEPTQKIIHLQKEWKRAGYLDHNDDNRLWKQFREVCDNFFENKKAFFESREVELVKNLERKEELIQKIEAYQLTGNAEEDLKTLKEFANEWQAIAFVPIKEKQRIYEKYKKTLDAKYEAMNLESGQIHLLKFKNNIEMLAHSEQADKLLAKEKNYIRDRIHKVQATITQYENNMGFFSNSKKMGSLLQEVEANLNQAREELALWQKKLKILSELKIMA